MSDGEVRWGRALHGTTNLTLLLTTDDRMCS